MNAKNTGLNAFSESLDPLAVKALVRSMRRELKDKHGVQVPHSALRASFLAACGENPHAFAGKVRTAEPPAKVTILDVTFEWVYPDEDGGSCPATLALETGALVVETWGVPADCRESCVRTRVQVGEDWMFETQYLNGCWVLTKEAKDELRAFSTTV